MGNGTSIVDESGPAQAEASTPGIHGDGGINTIAGAAEILRSMSSDKAKGKEPLIEDDSARGSKLAIRRSTPVVSSRGLVIDEPISVSSGGASGRMPVWDVSGGYSGGINLMANESSPVAWRDGTGYDVCL